IEVPQEAVALRVAGQTEVDRSPRGSAGHGLEWSIRIWPRPHQYVLARACLAGGKFPNAHGAVVATGNDQRFLGVLADGDAGYEAAVSDEGLPLAFPERGLNIYFHPLVKAVGVLFL